MANKHQRCSNCLYEGNASTCDKGMSKAMMREEGRFCLSHAFRPGWELEGTIFEGIEPLRKAE